MGLVIGITVGVLALVLMLVLIARSPKQHDIWATFHCPVCDREYGTSAVMGVITSSMKGTLSNGQEGFRIGPTIQCENCNATAHFSRDGSEYEVVSRGTPEG